MLTVYKYYTKFWSVILILTIILTIYEIIRSGNELFMNQDYCNIYKYSGWCNSDIAQIISTIYLIGFMLLIHKASN